MLQATGTGKFQRAHRAALYLACLIAATAARADPALTPDVLNPEVNQATIADTICNWCIEQLGSCRPAA